MRHCTDLLVMIIRTLWPPHAGRRVRTDTRVRPYTVAVPYTPQAAPVPARGSVVRPYVLAHERRVRAADERRALDLLASIATDAGVRA